MAYKDIEVKRAKNREWQRNNRKRQTKYMAGWFRRNLNAWIKYFESKGLNPICQICGKKLKWKSSTKSDVIVFDHRDGNKNIRIPKDFIISRPPNDKNTKVFLEENLGILCWRHNSILRNSERKRLMEYLNGKI